MYKKKIAYLIYQKDFSERGEDRYFLYNSGAFSEISSEDVINIDYLIITHDFWLISSSLYKKHNQIPNNVLDVVLISRIISGIKKAKGDTQPWDITNTIKPLYKDAKDFDNYLEIFYRRNSLNEETYMLFSHKLAEYTDNIFNDPAYSDELNRIFDLELPLYNELMQSACRGIPVSNDKIRTHKKLLKINYYRELKKFAETHNVLYQIPNDFEKKEKLLNLGYDIEDFSLNFLIDFLPSQDGYTDDLRKLEKTFKNFHIFNSIPSKSIRLNPIVESFSTSTARIYHKSPSIQNISKKYRDIFVPDNQFSLCYVDYDQFEVGVMAALSNDEKMRNIYENTDAYNDLAQTVFNDISFRKKAKILFLSYTYGMTQKNLMSSIEQLGGNSKKAKEYFAEFSTFESWKKSIYDKFQENGQISTICANYLNRQQSGDLTSKEQRSSVNHVIQGSASYIFKKALLELSKETGVQLLIPMHDAVLFQHTDSFDNMKAVTIFENTMTNILEWKVKGKASIEHFYQA